MTCIANHLAFDMPGEPLWRYPCPRPSVWRWHLDEMLVKIDGERRYLWRAVEHQAERRHEGAGHCTTKAQMAPALRFAIAPISVARSTTSSPRLGKPAYALCPHLFVRRFRG